MVILAMFFRGGYSFKYSYNEPTPGKHFIIFLAFCFFLI